MTVSLPLAVDGFLAAVGRRDAEAAVGHLAEDVVYHFLVPLPPVVGRSAVLEILSGSVAAAERVEWIATSAATAGPLTFLERVDRFRFLNGSEAQIECACVFEVRDDLITEVRDYADATTWRDRKAAALQG